MLTTVQRISLERIRQINRRHTSRLCVTSHVRPKIFHHKGGKGQGEWGGTAGDSISSPNPGPCTFCEEGLEGVQLLDTKPQLNELCVLVVIC